MPDKKRNRHEGDDNTLDPQIVNKLVHHILKKDDIITEDNIVA